MFSRIAPRLITPLRATATTTTSIITPIRSSVSTRSFATRMAATASLDIITLIKADHRKVEELYEEYKASTDVTSKKTIAHSIIKELVIHANTEELVLYPIVKEVLNQDLRDHALEEHAAVERGLYELENNLKVGDAEFDRVLAQTMMDVQHHVKEEETDMLPKFAKAMDQERLMKLGAEFTATKKHAPHRPHPMAPKTGMAGKLAKAAGKQMDDLTDPLESKQ